MPFGTFETVGETVGGRFGNFGGRRNFPGFGRPGLFSGGHRTGLGHRSGVFVAPRGVGPQLGNRIRGRVLINPGQFRSRGNFSGFGGRFSQARSFRGGGASSLALVGLSNVGYDYSYERSELISRFNELSIARAGLKARFRELEEEARRAGVPPGWLRE